VRVESRREKRNRNMRGRKLEGKEREWIDRFLLEDGEGLEELDSPDSDLSFSQNHEPKSQVIPHQSQKLTGPPPFPPRICLHSFSASSQMLSQYITRPSPTTAYPCEVYYSFSTAVNFRNLERLEEVLRKVPRERILVESDLHIEEEEIDVALEEAAKIVGEVREWDAEETRGVLWNNWYAWAYGSEDEQGVISSGVQI